MDFIETTLETLQYDKVKAVVRLVPVVRRGRITFDFRPGVFRNYAYAWTRDGKFFVPCFVMKHPVAKGVFADVRAFEQVRRPMDFGTYEDVPKLVPAGLMRKFVEVRCGFPAYEGFFQTPYEVMRAWRELKRRIVDEVLPANRVKDAGLVETMDRWSAYGGE